jgi:RNA polymerase sigma-70 factor (ECF subfamily)
MRSNESRSDATVVRVDDPDLGLLERWRAGERDAGEALFERHFESLYRFFQSKSSGDADELVQSTLLACLTAREQFRGDSNFRAYLFTIARNKLYRYLRERRHSERFDVTITSVAEVITTPRTVLARDQAHRALLAALRELSIEQQTLLELYYWEELDTLELGKIFDVAPGTIRIWLFRARGRLRELLASNAPATLEEMDRIVRNARGPARSS